MLQLFDATVWPIPASIGERMKCSVWVGLATVRSLEISTAKLGACRVYDNCPETLLRWAPSTPSRAARWCIFVSSEEDLARVKKEDNRKHVRDSSWPRYIRFSYRSFFF